MIKKEFWNIHGKQDFGKGDTGFKVKYFKNYINLILPYKSRKVYNTSKSYFIQLKTVKYIKIMFQTTCKNFLGPTFMAG